MLCHGDELRPALEGWLEAKLPPGAKFIGRLQEGQPVAVAGIANWSGWDCELYIGGPKGLSRSLIRAVFGYVFNELNCRHVTGRVDASLPWAGELSKLGFVLEGTLRQAAPSGADYLVFGMLRHECKWVTHGK